MSKNVKIWLIVAASLILAGAMIFGGAMMAGDWDFSKLSTVEYETVSYSPEGEFKNISVTSNTASVRLIPSTDGKIRVDCRDVSGVRYDVTVEQDTLTVGAVDTRKWYQHIHAFDFGAGFPAVSVYLPVGEYGDLTVRGSTGDVEIPKEFTFGDIDIAVSTGDVRLYASAEDIGIEVTTGDITASGVSAHSMELSVTTGRTRLTDVACTGDVKLDCSTGSSELKNVTCTDLTSTGDSGSISMEALIASGKMRVERVTGGVTFESCDASSVYIRTDTGRVKGSFVSPKNIHAQSYTGRVKVPPLSDVGGICEIITDTGNIKIEIRSE